MYFCNQCKRSFKTKSKLNNHSQRKTRCRIASHFCSMCSAGLTSKRSLLNHKQRCKKRPDVDPKIEAQVQLLKKQVNDFLERLDGNFMDKLKALAHLFDNETVTVEPNVNTNDNTI